ncbi:MAG: serine/threonine protein kinase [Hyphomicrobiaceae bacterium]|nr:serine/threonine protein kinase [Hyphomicrobiaceae bacterium]
MTLGQTLPAGTVLVGDFRIEKVLGSGGFGTTYLAEELALARKVTIKEYFPNDFAMRAVDLGAVPRSQNSNEDYQWGLDRFIDEAQALAKFDHRNIVRVYRYFRANNTAYMVLHFEEGQSLKNWLRSLGRAPRQAELDKLIAPMLDALELIHAADFLHRDIAPDNIIVRTDGSPVLIDFGSARGEIAQHTRTVSALVKPGYSPYEQYSETGKQQGPWTDIYALAATLYHAITGKRPPDAPSRVVKDELKPAREAAISSYRPGFLKAIDRGLAIDIERRPKSVAAWRGDLLAPDVEAKRWFGRGRDDANAKDNAAENSDATRPLTGRSPNDLHPPQPDAPGRRGRFVDFIDGLKPAAADASAPEQAAPAAPAGGAAAAAVIDRPRAEPAASGSILGNLFSKGREAKAAAPGPAPVAAEAAPQPARAEGGLLMPLPATPLKPVARKTPPKPRPIRSGRRSWWRPLAFKLLIGIGIAALAVTYQDRLPTFEFRGSGLTTSGAQHSLPEAAKAQSSGAEESERAAPKPVQSLLIRRIKAHAAGETRAQFTGDGNTIVTTGADSTLKLWSADGGTLVRTLEMDDGPATALAVSGKRALTGHSEGSVAYWDLETGAKIARFKRSDVRIWAVAFDGASGQGGDSGRFFVASHDWSVTVWELRTPSAPLHVFEGHKSAVQALAYDANRGVLASGGADKAVRLWSVGSLSQIRSYRREGDFVTGLGFSPDGKTLAVGLLDGRIRVLSTRSRRRLRTLSGHDGGITALGFVGDNVHFVSMSRDGTARLWSTKRRRAVRTYGSPGAALSGGALSADGLNLVTASVDGTVTVWRVGRLSSRPRRRSRR